MGIDIQNLQFSYGSKEVLKKISLKIEEGDFVAVIGPNGAGKTTFVKCLNHILKAESGSVKVDGQLLSHFTQKELAQRISYVPQVYETQLSFSVYEFVLMGRYPYLSPFTSIAKEDEGHVLQALEQTSSLELKERAMNTLSGGECQRVFISAALAQGGNVLVLDEPATFLDPKHQVEVYRLLKTLNEKSGITIVMVTHDINCALHFGKKILALRSGEMVYWGQANELLEGKILESIFETPFQVVKKSETVKFVFPEMQS